MAKGTHEAEIDAILKAECLRDERIEALIRTSAMILAYEKDERRSGYVETPYHVAKCAAMTADASILRRLAVELCVHPAEHLVPADEANSYPRCTLCQKVFSVERPKRSHLNDEAPHG